MCWVWIIAAFVIGGNFGVIAISIVRMTKPAAGWDG
jgi:hypothetical protein